MYEWFRGSVWKAIVEKGVAGKLQPDYYQVNFSMEFFSMYEVTTDLDQNKYSSHHFPSLYFNIS